MCNGLCAHAIDCCYHECQSRGNNTQFLSCQTCAETAQKTALTHKRMRFSVRLGQHDALRRPSCTNPATATFHSVRNCAECQKSSMRKVCPFHAQTIAEVTAVCVPEAHRTQSQPALCRSLCCSRSCDPLPQHPLPRKRQRLEPPPDQEPSPAHQSATTESRQQALKQRRRVAYLHNPHPPRLRRTCKPSSKSGRRW